MYRTHLNKIFEKDQMNFFKIFIQNWSYLTNHKHINLNQRYFITYFILGIRIVSKLQWGLKLNNRTRCWNFLKKNKSDLTKNIYICIYIKTRTNRNVSEFEKKLGVSKLSKDYRERDFFIIFRLIWWQINKALNYVLYN